jgi:hypothetical protein
VFTTLDTVLAVPEIAPPALAPVLCTALAADGLAPLSSPATLPATPLIAEPALEPAPETPWATVPVTLVTVPGGTGTLHAALVHA